MFQSLRNQNGKQKDGKQVYKRDTLMRLRH